MRAPGYAARRTGLRRIDLRSLVVRDFPLKAAALAISVLAFVAVAESTQQAVVTFRVPVERPAEVPAGYVLRGTLGDVAVTLHGPQPAIAKLAQTDIHPVPDLGQADLGRNDVQNVALRVPLADQNVVAETDPPTVPVRIEQIVTRSVTVQVRFANDPPAGFQPGSATMSSAEVKITGAQSLVASVAAVYATLRFGDTPIDISASADAVAVQIQGTPDKLVAVDRIDTAAIDVSGLNTNRSFRVPLLLPDGVSLLQPTDATVGITVVPLSGTRPFPVVAVQATGVAAGLVAETDPSTVSVVVSGPTAALAALVATDVTATVDASGKGAGTYQADVVLKVPAGVTVISLEPIRVTLTMRLK